MAQKVTLITGCSTGIGLSLAVKLAQNPAKKYLVYSSMRNLAKKESLEAAAGDALNDTLFIRPLDVVNDDSVSNAVKDIMNTHGRIDVVVNNAGIATFNPLEYTPLEDVRDVFETNFFGIVRMMHAVLPIMKEQRSGHIINVSSVAGVLGHPFYESYSASKFAVEGLTESLASRMKAFNVKLSSILPGPVDTNINENIVTGSRLPDRQKIDPITREQLKILATHQKDHFTNSAQTAEDIADIVQNVIEMGLSNMPVRFLTGDYGSKRTAKKYSDFGAASWIDFIRQIVEDPAVKSESNSKNDKSQD